MLMWIPGCHNWMYLLWVEADLGISEGLLTVAGHVAEVRPTCLLSDCLVVASKSSRYLPVPNQVKEWATGELSHMSSASRRNCYAALYGRTESLWYSLDFL